MLAYRHVTLSNYSVVHHGKFAVRLLVLGLILGPTVAAFIRSGFRAGLIHCS